MERSSHEAPSESASLILPRINPTTAGDGTNPNPNPPSSSFSRPRWPTIDGPLGLSEEDSISYARRFFKFGFLLFPWLWAVNCFYFWPVLRHSRSFPQIRRCMEQMSNGRFHAVKHRVMMKGDEKRYSLATFQVPIEGTIIKPPKKLVDEEHYPQILKDFNYMDFITFSSSKAGMTIESS